MNEIEKLYQNAKIKPLPILNEIEKMYENAGITKEDIEQFKKDCKARGLRLPKNCTDEWCINQLKALFEDKEQ